MPETLSLGESPQLQTLDNTLDQTPDRIRPQNFEEKLIWQAIVYTYVFYFTGTLYFVAPILGWILVLRLIYKKYLGANLKISLVHWVWIVAMIAMLVALIGGLLNFDYSLKSIIKAVLGWGKGWALFAVLPMVGVLPIRPRLIYRATCIVCLHSLLLFPIYWLGYILRVTTPLYTVPLNFFGAPPGCFEVSFYVLDPGTNIARIGLFGPWASAVGFIGNCFFPLVLQEQNRRWKLIGIAACVLMVYVCSQSRAAVVTMPLAWLLTFGLSSFARPKLLIVYGFLSAIAGVLFTPISERLLAYYESVKNARKGSTEVRDALDRIHLDRFPEAPIFGHAVPERGPKVVEHMPIGSHNTFTALLFLRGIVGLVAFVGALGLSWVNLVWNSYKTTVAFCGLQVWWILVFNSRYDSAEVTIYLVWQSLVIMGIAYGGKREQSQTAQSELS